MSCIEHAHYLEYKIYVKRLCLCDLTFYQRQVSYLRSCLIWGTNYRRIHFTLQCVVQLNMSSVSKRGNLYEFWVKNVRKPTKID